MNDWHQFFMNKYPLVGTLADPESFVPQEMPYGYQVIQTPKENEVEKDI